ncbi:unnamed protein product (macronuclear) [Paramecium tetraurelia]|uniref:Uncharacterized protein n=1 Tax=Paramecium tetraurelia TaxID=5888 RepID=A0BRF0_PARTE|nr:uncharacterized protein GSPATT00031348001 [Paramecium tetraurelia]CAK61117.1 unnamed protein product [Paramecium tetraurelia]|eukprot:XP_001428515.1 hypothetical protein (macronuclear) [Paramecium tetraurelia strain d4-2]
MQKSWETLCKNLRSPFLQHFLDIQTLIDELAQQIDQPQVSHEIAIQIQEMISQIVQIIDIEHQNLLDGFEQSVLLFAQIDSDDRVKQFETLNLIQELFNKLALSYFYSDDLLEEKKVQMPINDGTSTCSDFSDDNFEVEDFEAQVAQELFQQIKGKLQEPEIEQKCYQFQFTIFQEELNIMDFFNDSLELQIKEYDVIVFLNYSGLLQKLMNYKQDNQLEFFVGQLYIILNKIKNDEVDSLIETNCFELKYSRLSQRKFLRCKILSNLYTKLVYEKLDRWRKTQHIQEIQGENLKALRRFIVQHKAPLSRWEVSILSIQDVQINNENILDKFQKLVIALSLPYDLLLENFNILDKLYVNLQQFQKWFKLSSIPFTVSEISSLFKEVSQTYGYYTNSGIKVIQRVDFYQFLEAVYAPNQNEKTAKEKPEVKSVKYNDEITIQQYNRHLQLKVNDLQLQLNQKNATVDQLKKAQQETQQTTRIKTKSNNEIKDKESEIKIELLHQAEINSINNETQQQLKVVELKWKNKTKDLLFDLENKDKQIDQYRQQIEALMKELEWVKTERKTK